MGYRVIKNWIESTELLTRNSVIMVPFLIWGMVEAIALECLYFFSGVPFRGLLVPLVAKYYGEEYLHYPGNIIILPKLFANAEMIIYIFLGAFLTVITIDLVVRLAQDKDAKAKPVLEETIRRYAASFAYAILITAAGILIKRFHPFVFDKTIGRFLVHLPQELLQTAPFLFLFSLLVMRLAVNAFLILALPIIVIRKKLFVTALLESVGKGALNFLPLFSIMFLPYLIYMPIVLLKSYQDKLVAITFPEIVFYLSMIGIFVLKIVECFVVVCVTRFLLQKYGMIREKEEPCQETA